jgi:hypothetical protein
LRNFCSLGNGVLCLLQEDKDLVHEFVQNDGLACLIKVGSEVDQNYQNYILRALGQVMLYVDGMNGIMAHGETVQWLYSLIASKFRLVLKTALKLLLVFVEYKESNCSLLVSAIRTVDLPCGESAIHFLLCVKQFLSAIYTQKVNFLDFASHLYAFELAFNSLTSDFKFRYLPQTLRRINRFHHSICIRIKMRFTNQMISKFLKKNQ